MPIDPSIPLSAHGMGPLVNPMDIVQQAQQLRLQRESAEALAEQRRAQAEQRKEQTAKLARDAAKEVEGGAALDELFSTYEPGKPIPTAPVGKLYRAYGPDRASAIVKGLADFHTADLTNGDKLRDSMLKRIAALKALPEDRREAAYSVVVKDYASKGVLRPEEIAPYSPTILDDYEQQLMTPEQRRTAAESAARLPGIKAQSALAEQVTAGAKGGLTPEQQQQAADRAASARIAAGNLSVAQARERREATAATAAVGDKTDLSPAGLDAAAMMFAKTGQLPALGMGDKTTRKKIINRAADLMPGLDIASAKADFGANSESLKNVTKTLDTLTAFENTAGKNLDQFLALSAKIPDTGVPWLNTPIRVLNLSGLGSSEQAAANAARDVALREIARVTNDPKLSGVLSDSARHEVAGLSPQNATFAQIKAVAKTLKTDMANVHSSMTEQRDAISGRIKAAGAPADPATGMIHAKDPQGNIHQAKAGTPLPAGWTIVQGGG